MSSQGIKCTLARDVLSLLFGVLGAGCFCPGLHWEDCQFCLWCDLRLVSDDLYRDPPPFVCCLLRLAMQDFSFPLQGATTICLLSVEA
ncbi:hypothetical protein BDE02_02G183200 [Populus trichocarpa]|nr:hypothetical protein BDE02_02G183200 [Populus trichocarpa]KAI5599209.1 hypothetical protein BDE02_02G183200 [Populus trichocarpa]KAI5599210.1 hypothetical protein BDE02_02G183200 [Populus trichocarpa]